MGRTKRRRSLKTTKLKTTNLDHEESTINLRKWLKENNFCDPLNLQLRNFPQTGRGVTSNKPAQENDVLVRVPLDLLITFDTVAKSGLLKCVKKNGRFSTQTLIAFYLTLEKHKGDQSLWKHYINTMPDPEPLLPWMCTSEELGNFPGHLQQAAMNLYETFSESFINLRKSICPRVLCDCCKNPIRRVLGPSLFKWAYVLVNTRAVYIDPKNFISENSSHISILSDEPSMALCPFLDMFNHSYLAQTKVNVVSIQGRDFYELRTTTKFKKYEQFFISYGAHDNEKLLMEYGFFIPGNIFDSVKFSFKEIVDVLKLHFSERSYAFIKKHRFDVEDLYLCRNDVSFNLKAILFIAYYPERLNFHCVVFSDSYPSDFNDIIQDCMKKLLGYKCGVYQRDVDRFSSGLSEFFSLLKNFLDYRIRIMQILSIKSPVNDINETI